MEAKVSESLIKIREISFMFSWRGKDIVCKISYLANFATKIE